MASLIPAPSNAPVKFVEIVRRIVARDEPVEYQGRHYTLPYPGGTGLGKPLKSTVHPLRDDIPIFLAAEGPKNVSFVGGDLRRVDAAVLRPDRRPVLPRSTSDRVRQRRSKRLEQL